MDAVEKLSLPGPLRTYCISVPIAPDQASAAFQAWLTSLDAGPVESVCFGEICTLLRQPRCRGTGDIGPFIEQGICGPSNYTLKASTVEWISLS